MEGLIGSPSHPAGYDKLASKSKAIESLSPTELRVLGREWQTLATTKPQAWISLLDQSGAATQRRMIQARVDMFRQKISIILVRNHIKKAAIAWDVKDPLSFQLLRHKLKQDLTRKYVWFTCKTLNSRQLRNGDPPRDEYRPYWLRGIELGIDISALPFEVWKSLTPGGKMDQMIKDEREYKTT
jgi:hypothetical protein